MWGGRDYIGQATREALKTELNFVFLEEMALFNTATLDWTLVTNTSGIKRTSHGTVSTGGLVYSFGGYFQGEYNAYPFNSVIFSSPFAPCVLPGGTTGSAGVWCEATLPSSSSSSFPTARYEFASTLRRGKILVIYGGFYLVQDGTQRALDDFWSLNLSSITSWKQAEAVVDSPGTSTTLLSTLYFLISVLTLMVGFFIFFILNMRRRAAESAAISERRRRGTGRFQPVLLPAANGEPPATAEMIAALVQVAYSKPPPPPASVVTPSETGGDVEEGGQPKAGEDGDLCAICLGEFAEGDLVCPLPCSHVFHPECIQEWLVKRNSCPLCKARLLGGGAVVATENPTFEPTERA